MNITCVIQRYHPAIGGAEIHAKKFIDYLSKKHTVSVYTTDAFDLSAFWDINAKKIQGSDDEHISYCKFLTPKQIPLNFIKKFPLSSLHPGPFSLVLWDKLFIQKPNCDLIFAMSYPYDHILPAFASSKKWNIPIIITPLIHQTFPELFLTGMKLSILNESQALTVSTQSEKSFLELQGIDTNKISIIPPASEQPQSISNSAFRKKYKIHENSNIVLFVGSKSEEKGIFTLIKSMVVLWKSGYDIILVVIGSKTTKYLQFISKIPEKFRNNILDLENIDDFQKNEAYAACDVFALPSKSESFGIVYLEAWNFKKPVIACDINSSKDLINHNIDGLLVKFDDVKKLSFQLRHLLDNPNERKRLGENGKIKSSKFSWEESCKQFEQLCVKTVDNFKSH